jgi:hypothetical protein
LGVCSGDPKVCPADECFDPGTCNPGTGNCSDEAMSANGSVCASTAGGRCATGACVPTFMVVRLGDGSSALTSAATAVFVERHYLDPVGALIETVAVPTAVDGNNQPLTMGGTTTNEGALTRSGDNKYVTLAGYAATPGTTGPNGAISTTTSASTHRIVGRISSDGTVDTSTQMSNAFNQNPVRGATSTNGTDFWVTGAGIGSMQYVQLGSSGASTMLLLSLDATVAPQTTRVAQIFGNELYATGSAKPFANVFKIGGNPPPTTGGQTAVSLPGMPITAGLSSYSFVFFDTDGIDGFDTLYVADDRTLANGGGLQKWLLLPTTVDGGTVNLWTLSATFTASAVRGLAGIQIGSDIHLIATSTETSANRILYFIDNGTPNPTPTVLGTSSTIPGDGGAPTAATIFRGVALGN